MQARTQRKLIYLALCVGVGVGAIVDVFTNRAGIGSVINNITQFLLILVLSVSWVTVDARARDQRVSRATAILLVLVLPVGIAVHLFRTRSILSALLTWIGYFGGLAISGVAFGMIAAALLV